MCQEKVCKKCGLLKPFDEFHKNVRMTDGRLNKCKKCFSEEQKQRRDKDPEKYKSWWHNNKEKYNERKKEKYKNRTDEEIEEARKYQKTYVEANRDRVREYAKEYDKKRREEKGDELNEYSKQRRKTPEAQELHKKWREENKDKIKEYTNRRREENPIIKLSGNIRGLFRLSFLNRKLKKGTKTISILGCTFEEFKSYLESKFEEWMTWDNHGKYESGEYFKGWDLDHIIPISTASTEEEVIKLNHYTNFQPLCSYINRHIKRDRIDFNYEEFLKTLNNEEIK